MGNNRAKGNIKFRNQGQKTQYAPKRTPQQLMELDEISFLSSSERTSSLKNDTSSARKAKSVPKVSNLKTVDEGEDSWSPSPYAAFKLLVSARFAAALWTTISDCDETFNYWEPVHFLLYGKGFQTWEYSPEFALRSYTYLLFHTVPAKIYDYIFKPNPLLVFFLVRCFLGFISACSEVFLYRSIRKYFGGNICRIALVTSLFAPGMFISSSALLPSSFSSYMTALAIGAWIDKSYHLSIFTVAVSALLSWPFAALTGLLIALDIVIVQRKVRMFLTWSMISLAVVLQNCSNLANKMLCQIPIVYIDSTHYNKLVIAPWNIVKYNVLSSKGPDLYGTEPWTFYIINGFLNFNIAFVMTLASPLLLLISWKSHYVLRKKFLIIGTTFVWLTVFILQPHKEERFMFPIFPLIPICGAIGIDSMQRILTRGYHFVADASSISPVAFRKWLKARDVKTWLSGLGFLIIFTSNLIGCSRIVALHYGYRAPFDVFFNLQREGTLQKFETEVGDRDLTLCYGKEWYRFPSSFFLPSTKWNTRFIKSDFKGQLPNLYPAFDPKGTMRLPDHMNDLNTEEPTRYVPLSECDFLVDSIDEDQITPNQPNYAANKEEWKIISEQDFISSARSHPFFRAFYIPFLSQQYVKYNRYVVLQRRKMFGSKNRRVRSAVGKEFSSDDLDVSF